MKPATPTGSPEPGEGRGASADEPVSRWSALVTVLANWRDWNLPVKLAAVTLVPVVFAIVLGTMQISDQVDKASSYRRVDRLVAANEELRGLVAALQNERGAAGVLLAAGATDTVSRLGDEQDATDTARAAFLRAAGRVTLDHEVSADRYADVRHWLAELDEVRGQVAEPGFDAANSVTRYSAVIDSLLRFDRTMAAESLDATLASSAAALHDLEAIKEEVSYQQAVVAVGIVRGASTGPEQDALAASVGRQADLLADFYAVAGEDLGRRYDNTVAGTGVASRNNVVAAIIGNLPGTPLPTNAQDWADGSTLTENRIADVAKVLGTALHNRSTALQDKASDAAGIAAVILLVALVVAIGVMFVVGRHLLGSLAALRRGALDLAERGLPDAVTRIRERGEGVSEGEPLSPIPVSSMDEVGQVARAFDAVQRQALKLATEQAGLRAKFSSVFVNLSRRSQGLVQRQLQLLERLERDEEDADQLATLFQLDHLATRMRRNNENLMVLSGSDVGRRNQRPAALADLLRAAVSEIEQYQRVVLLPPPAVQVVGYAVGDLVRLVAELLDNATAFSAPETQVTIASHSFEDGTVCIAVLDEGIGMSQAELDEANAKLADTGTIDVTTSRRMGLFVIGRLAGRHGVEVRLNGGSDVQGVRATVTVPSDVIVAGGPVSDPVRENRHANGTSLLAPFTPGGVPGGRNGHANGHSNGHSNGHQNGVNGQANGSARLVPPSLPRHDQEPSWLDHEPPRYGQEPRQEPSWLDQEPPWREPAGPEQGSPQDLAGNDQESSRWDRTPPSAARPETSAIWPDSAARADSAAQQDSAARQGSATRPDSAARRDSAARPDSATTRPESGAQPESGTARSERDERSDDERLPLPRRSPGGKMPGPKVGPPAPADLARPRGPFELPARQSPADGLFNPTAGTAGGGWWSAGSPVDRHLLEETTPIFDEMVSAWFRSVSEAVAADRTPPPAPTPKPKPPRTDEPPRGRDVDSGGTAWNFAADSGFDTARAVSNAEPSDFTSGGLPRRSPRQRLIPGSAVPAAADGLPRHGRDADDVRSRLSEYRQGVRKARDHRHGVEPPSSPNAAPVVPPRPVVRRPFVPENTETAQLDLSGAGWRFAADIGWHAANQASTATPADFTSGGLPRRSPRQNLVPGSVSHSGHGNGPGFGARPPRIDRAEEMRGRLGNFQMGLFRGRRSLADRSPANGFADHKQQQESE